MESGDKAKSKKNTGDYLFSLSNKLVELLDKSF